MSSYSRELYQWYKEHGICVRCHRTDAAYGFVSCPDCLYKNRMEKAKTRTQEHTRQLDKERANKHRAAGLCIKCSKPAEPGRVRCRLCLLRARQYQRKTYIYHPKPEGICRMCDKPAMAGHSYCIEHYPQMVEKAAHMREINRGFDMKYIFR